MSEGGFYYRYGAVINCETCRAEIHDPHNCQRFCATCKRLRQSERTRRHQLARTRTTDEVNAWIQTHPLPRFLPSPAISGELWKPVVGYEGLYEVSSMGRVRSFVSAADHCLIGGRSKSGIYVSLHNGDSRRQMTVHRMMMLAFNPIKSPGRYDVHHINRDTTDNRLENLEWRLKSHNRKGRAKLTADQVREIRRLWYADPQSTWKKIAAQFGVNAYTVRDILYRKTWAELEDAS